MLLLSSRLLQLFKLLMRLRLVSSFVSTTGQSDRKALDASQLDLGPRQFPGLGRARNFRNSEERPFQSRSSLGARFLKTYVDTF
jgi:hypothetical protein